MKLGESLRMSWRSIRDHTLRSVLTTLGIIIGVAAVITFVTLGASLQAAVVQTVVGEESDIITVSTASDGSGDFSSLLMGGNAVFTQRDVAELEANASIESVIPQAFVPTRTITHDEETVSRQQVMVVTAEYFEARDVEVVDGRTYTGGERAVVLNQQAARLFGDPVRVGERIRITRPGNSTAENATVVGIVSSSGSAGGGSDPFQQDADPMVYAPPEPFYERVVQSPATGERQRVYSRLLVVADGVESVQSAQQASSEYLHTESDARQLKAASTEFQVTTRQELITQIRAVSETFTTYISGIALISLLVGSIGIANIMLVSVTERTREIGIMKAVGASRRDILELFLVEAILLGLIGSILGAVVGYLGGYTASTLLSLPPRFELIWFGVSIGVGILVGVLAGLYPAWNAAVVDPIKALRSD